MPGLSFYNPHLKLKQVFSPANSQLVCVQYIADSSLPEQHIKRLRSITVLEMMTRWLEATGTSVTVATEECLHQIDLVVGSVADTANTVSSGVLLPHVVQVGDITVSRVPNGNEDLYCAKSYITNFGDEVVRFFLLRSQYRTTLQFTKLQVEDARRTLDRFYRVLKAVPPSTAPFDSEQVHGKRFIDAMNDDFNMLKVVAVMNDLANAATSSRSANLAAQLKHIGNYLNLLQSDPIDYLHRPIERKNISENKWSFMKQLDLPQPPVRKIA